jgi:hypothetical protein
MLSHVSFKSERAREHILGINVGTVGNKKFLPEESDVLAILFSLLPTAIPPEVRGLVLSTIATLVRVDNVDQLTAERSEQIKNVCQRCWEMLEFSQIIPIEELSQYSSTQPSGRKMNFTSTHAIFSENHVSYLCFES